MYAEAKKDIYGTLDSSQLLWGKLSKILEERAYQVKKMVVKGKQCTILCHVGDLKMLHVYSDIVSSVFSDTG